MTRVRHLLGPIAAVWLLCQAATLTLALALLGVDLGQCAGLGGIRFNNPRESYAELQYRFRC